MKVSVDWLKDFVKVPSPLERVAERLTMAGLEVKKAEGTTEAKDVIWEIEITTNRPDWLSHWGVARELAAVENLPLKVPEIRTGGQRKLPSGWRVTLQDPNACPYYSGVLIEGLQCGDTPEFIQRRLRACGLRSINLIVDITNYVLLETGQPLHAFDADLIRGQEIVVRRARKGETLKAIDQSLLELTPEDLVIADKERPVALAGVMGGMETEVTEKTRNIFLESAFFHPQRVRQSSRRHALTSESSYRFERRVDPESVDFGRERALRLIEQYARPRFISGVLKGGRRPVTRKSKIHLSSAEIVKVLGVSIKPGEVTSILKRLGLEVRPHGNTSWRVRVPSYRSDLTRSIDLIEEIIRIYGYDRVPETLPERAALTVRENPLFKISEHVRYFFSGIGYYDTVTFSMISERGLDQERDLRSSVAIVNPQNKELNRMRPVLLPSLLNVIQRNQRLRARCVPIFEVANTYYRQPGRKHPVEELKVGIALWGILLAGSWMDRERPATFFDLKGAIEALMEHINIRDYRIRAAQHPLLSPECNEELMVGKDSVGFLGRVRSNFLRDTDIEGDVFYGELSLEVLKSHAGSVPQFRELPRFPAIQRDISLTVDEAVKAGEVIAAIERLNCPLIKKVELFDLFRGGRVPPGKKNLSFRLTYQSHQRTLFSEDIQQLHDEVARTLLQHFKGAFQ